MKQPKIIIVVEGGTVCSAYANIPDLDVVILDHDNDCEFNEEQSEAQKIITYVQEQRAEENTAVDFVEVY
jgi:hypothetical protein